METFIYLGMVFCGVIICLGAFLAWNDQSHWRVAMAVYAANGLTYFILLYNLLVILGEIREAGNPEKLLQYIYVDLFAHFVLLGLILYILLSRLAVYIRKDAG